MRCPACEALNDAQMLECTQCGSKLPKRSRRRGSDDDEEMDEEAYRQSPFYVAPNEYANVTALRAYHLGLLGLIPVLGVALGAAAVAVGIFGLRYARTHPRARGNAQAKVGILLGCLGFAFNAAGIALIAVGLQGG